MFSRVKTSTSSTKNRGNGIKVLYALSSENRCNTLIAFPRLNSINERLLWSQLTLPEEIHKDGLSWCQVAYSREGLKDIDGAIAAYKESD